MLRYLSMLFLTVATAGLAGTPPTTFDGQTLDAVTQTLAAIPESNLSTQQRRLYAFAAIARCGATQPPPESCVAPEIARIANWQESDTDPELAAMLANLTGMQSRCRRCKSRGKRSDSLTGWCLTIRVMAGCCCNGQSMGCTRPELPVGGHRPPLICKPCWREILGWGLGIGFISCRFTPPPPCRSRNPCWHNLRWMPCGPAAARIGLPRPSVLLRESCRDPV